MENIKFVKSLVATVCRFETIALQLVDPTILHDRNVIPFCLRFSDHASNHERKFSKLENYKPVLEKILKETCHAKRESPVSFCQQRH